MRSDPNHPDYARLGYYAHAHHLRYKRHVKAMPRKLSCQDCSGAGGEVEPVTDEGQGPFMPCGWCEGTGYVTPWLRGMWLSFMADEKRRQLGLRRQH